MVGYVAPYKPEMKYREMAVYKAYYCSMCHAIKKLGGRINCFGLNHDLTSFLVLRAALQPCEEVYTKKACVWNPIVKINVVSNYQELVDETAKICIFLNYYKILDNCVDNKDLWPFIAKGVLFPQYIKLKKKNTDIDAQISTYLSTYYKLETNAEMTTEMIVDPYATLIGKLMSQLEMDEFVQRCLYWMGYQVAKCTCLIDAIDDFSEDLNQHKSNILWRSDSTFDEIILKSDDVARLREDVVGENMSMIQYCQHQIASTLGMLPILRHETIIYNIFTEGIANSIEKAITKGNDY